MVEKLHGVKTSFKKVDEIKGIIEEHCDDNVSVPIDSLGYVEPGHGAKGKQRWLITDADIADMYKGKKEILLRCYSRGQGGAKKNGHCHLIVRVAASPQNRPDTPIM